MIKFAENAETTIPENPSPQLSYRNAQLTDEAMRSGFDYASTASSADYNQLEFLISEFTDLIEQCNVLAWSALTKYRLGGVVVASDNKIYQSLIDDNINNDPTQSGDWVELIEKINLANPLLKKDLSNAVVTGTGQTLITADEPQIISPDVTTQPPGTNNTKAASCAFVQAALNARAVSSTGVVANCAVVSTENNSCVPNETFTITTPMPIRLTDDVPAGAATEIKSGTWVYRGVIGDSCLIQRVR